MPQPIKNITGLVARRSPRSILEREKLAALIGAISSTWAEIDETFLELFNLCTFAQPIQGDIYSHSGLSDALFESFVTLDARKRVIGKMIKLRYAPELFEEFEDIANDISKKSKARNLLIHGAWNICDDYPDDLIQIKDREWIVYTERDFNEILDRSVEVSTRLHDFHIRLGHSPRLDSEDRK